MADQNDRWSDTRDDGATGYGRGGPGAPSRRSEAVPERPDHRDGEPRSFGARGADLYGGFREPGYARPGVRGYSLGDYGDHGYDTDRAANREAAEHMMHRPSYGDRSGASYPSRDFGGPGSHASQRAGGYSSYRYGPSGHSQSGPLGGPDGERGWWDRTRDEVSSWFGDDEAERRRRMDEAGMVADSHRGRGPKNYTRSDARIQEDVNQHLTDDHGVDATHIEVSVNSGEVTLSGTVSRREDKRRAEDVAERVSGVKHLQNNLRVHDPASADSPGYGFTRATSAADARTDDAAKI